MYLPTVNGACLTARGCRTTLTLKSIATQEILLQIQGSTVVMKSAMLSIEAHIVTITTVWVGVMYNRVCQSNTTLLYLSKQTSLSLAVFFIIPYFAWKLTRKQVLWNKQEVHNLLCWIQMSTILV